MADKAARILAALGGAANIVEVEACITRLRTEVNDASLVDEAALKAAGAHGVIKAGNAVQVIVGPEAGRILKLHPHAYVVVAEAGRAVLVHLGIDTVQLHGEGFSLLAAEGDQVAAGAPVVRWDAAAVEAAGRSPVCPVVALEAAPEALTGVVTGGHVEAGTVVFTWR